MQTMTIREYVSYVAMRVLAKEAEKEGIILSDVPDVPRQKPSLQVATRNGEVVKLEDRRHD